MLQTAIRCGRRLISDVWVWLSVGVTIVSWLSQIAGWSIPPTAWLAVIVFLMFGALCRAWITVDRLEDEKEKSRPQPDMSLRDVVERIVGPQVRDEDNYEFAGALKAIQQQALLGYIVVFGAEGTFLGGDTGPGGSGGPYIPVPARYWRSYNIDILSYLRDGAGQIGPRDNSEPSYYDLMLSRRQVDEIWPAPRKPMRVHFRWPIQIAR